MPAENTKIYTIDASFILAYLLPDEDVKLVNDLFQEYAQGRISFISSPILPFEVANGLKEASRKRITIKEAIALLKAFLSIKITHQIINFEDLLEISIKTNISIYDASYLCLSQKYNVPLLTLDEKLKSI